MSRTPLRHEQSSCPRAQIFAEYTLHPLQHGGVPRGERLPALAQLAYPRDVAPAAHRPVFCTSKDTLHVCDAQMCAAHVFSQGQLWDYRGDQGDKEGGQGTTIFESKMGLGMGGWSGLGLWRPAPIFPRLLTCLWPSDPSRSVFRHPFRARAAAHGCVPWAWVYGRVVAVDLKGRAVPYI